MFTSSVFSSARGVVYSTHVRVVLQYFYISSCETPLDTVAVRSYISPSTREPQTQRFRCTKLGLRHLTPFFFFLRLSVLPLLLTLRRFAFLPSRRCGWRLHGRIACATWWWCTPAGGKTQRRTSCWESTSPTKTGEGTTADGLDWVAHVLLYCIRCFPSFQQKLFDWNGVASVERHKDPSGR